jgi:regulator of CtrA degradation
MTDSASHAAFVDRAYDEARELLIQTRDYISGPSTAESRALETADRLRLTLELARLTRRLTEATAWLMLQKGVAAGEITPADAAKAEAARLEPDADGETDPAALARLPLTVRALIDRTRRLHGHVAALHRSLEAAPP